MNTFTLRKWYFDVVDIEGRSAIAYWAALEWGAATLRWHAATLHSNGEVARHRSSVRFAEEPTLRAMSPNAPPPLAAAVACGRTRLRGRGADEISWRSDAIDCEVSCLPLGPAFAAELRPLLDWRCEAPAGLVAIGVGGETVAGPGYAECLELRCPPWQLPIDELVWGRWVAQDGSRSVAWIEWRGAEPKTVTVVDGLSAQPIGVRDEEVRTAGETLTLRDRVVLHERTLGDLLGGVTRVVPGLPGRWLGLEDRKWLSRGTLTAPSGRCWDGWAIHERIVFP